MRLFKKLVSGCDYENNMSPDVRPVSRDGDPDVGAGRGGVMSRLGGDRTHRDARSCALGVRVCVCLRTWPWASRTDVWP